MASLLGKSFKIQSTASDTSGVQFRVGYDGSNKADFSVSSGGDLTIAPTGGDTNVTGNLAVSGSLTLGTNLPYSELNLGGNIVNADISATAEIAVSKLADGSARQLLQTDAAGTGVEWTSNVDVPGTLDVTGATTLDSTLTVAGDVSIADKIIHTGDTNTAIRFPAADTVTVETAGSERLRIDSSGNVLINSTAVAVATLFNNVEIGGNSSNPLGQPSLVIKANVGTADNYTGYLTFRRSAGTTDNSFTAVGINDRLGMIRWTGTDNANEVAAAELYAEVDGTSGTNDMPGRIIFATTPDGSATPSERMRITSGGYLRMASGSGGIQFNGDTAAANALDDYEEGTWTPVYTPTTSGSVATVVDGTATYVKVGKIVHVQARIYSSSISSPVGDISITGLPFANVSGSRGSGTISEAVRFNTDMPNIKATVGSGTSTIFLYKNATNVSNTVGVASGDISSSAIHNILSFSATYITS